MQKVSNAQLALLSIAYDCKHHECGDDVDVIDPAATYVSSYANFAAFPDYRALSGGSCPKKTLMILLETETPHV